MTMVVAGMPIDDFLAGAAESDEGAWLERIGLSASMLGLMVGAGLLLLLARVHHGPAAEVRSLLRVVSFAGVLAAVGASVQVAGIARSLDDTWTGVFTGDFGTAAMMRLVAGALLALGVLDHLEPVPARGRDRTGEAGEVAEESGAVEPVGSGTSAIEVPEADGDVRWVPSGASVFGMCGVAAGLLSFAFDGHTVSKGQRIVHAVFDVLHVVAGSVWLGGLVGLAVVALLRRGSPAGSLVTLVRRFSPFATVALVLVAVAGAAMAVMIADAPSDLIETDWGRALLVKVSYVAAAVGLGAYQRFRVIPSADPASAALERRSGIVLAVEVGVLLGVVAVTAFLVGASTV